MPARWPGDSGTGWRAWGRGRIARVAGGRPRPVAVRSGLGSERWAPQASAGTVLRALPRSCLDREGCG
eukprot:9847108-Alexandrium_andersonii.AAC.1